MSMGWSRRNRAQGSFRTPKGRRFFKLWRRIGAGVVPAACAAVLTSCGSDSSTGPRQVKAPPPVSRIIFSKTVDSVEVQRKDSAVATCVDSTGTNVTGCQLTWSVDDSTIATVSPTGVVTGDQAGNTSVHATVSSGITGLLRIVILPPAVASITYATTSFTLTEGDTLTIPAPKIVDRTGAVVTGRTPTYRSNSSALTVSPTGLVTAVTATNGVITATLDTVSVQLSFTVVPAPIGNVQVMPSILDMGVGHTVATQSSATGVSGQKITGRVYTYVVDKPAIAQVSTSGVVTGVSPGKANLTVSTNSVSKTVPISVAQLGPGGFVIDLQFVGTVSQATQQAAQQAVQRWEQIISAPLIPYHIVTKANDCGAGIPGVDKIETNVLVIIQEDSIDGPGKTVGLGGPCVLRDDAPQLTALGTVTLDSADAVMLQQQGLLVATLTHEIGHILGIGTLWDPADTFFPNLATGIGGANPVFIGRQARIASAALGFTADSTLGVPIENTGKVGDGTRDAHWRASVFGHELMTGTLHNGLNPLSLVTIQALGDFGYTVVPEAADDINVVNSNSPGSSIAPSLSIGTRMRETVLFPQFTVTRGGTLKPIPNARQPQIY
ncbi:MAG: Ig-like domain-containing protein [Gemmatimonadaceae bacterium]